MPNGVSAAWNQGNADYVARAEMGQRASPPRGDHSMSSREPPNALTNPTDLGRSAWERIKAYLINKKDQIYEEIKNYPRPIPACDQQFNYLLEERTRISQDLARLEEVCKESLTGSESLERIGDFIKSSRYLDAGVFQQGDIL
jgi:hypothetical protein